MPPVTLDYLEAKPASGNKAKQLVVLLHGLGADGSDLFSLAPHIAEELPDAHCVAPHAPFPCDLAPFGRQWFSLADRSEQAILKGLRTAQPILENFITPLLKSLHLHERDLALFGFSQGTMLSLHTGLRSKHAYAGILGYSGALIAPQLLEDELQSRPEICLVHGEADEVVPFVAFEEAVTALQKQHIFLHAYSRQNLGHGIDPAGLKIGIDFLKTVFSKVVV